MFFPMSHDVRFIQSLLYVVHLNLGKLLIKIVFFDSKLEKAYCIVDFEIPLLSLLNLSESSLSSEVEKRLADYLVTDRHYTWAEVRKDDIQTYNAALRKLCQLMFT